MDPSQLRNITKTSRHLSRLQAKGMLTVVLLLYSETVTLANAVSFWNNFNPLSKKQRHRSTDAPPYYPAFSAYPAVVSAHQKECPNSSPSPFPARGGGAAAHSSCPAPPSMPFTSSFQWSRLSKRVNSVKRYAEDCCMECSNCMDPQSAARQCHIPLTNMMRGGHQSTDGTVVTSLTTTTPYGIPLHAWKVIFQALLTALNVLCWLVPLKSKKIAENKLALGLANAFSGGVFLSLAFGHLIPECVHGFDSSWPEATPFVLVMAGYLLIFFVEKVAFDAHEILHEMESRGEASSASTHHHHHHDAHGNNHSQGPTKTVADKIMPITEPLSAKASTSSSSSSSLQPNGETGPSSGRSAVILLGALAVHSILEMMALGLSDSFGDCALLTLSISLHQPAESIALLVAFLKSGMSHDQIISFLSIFSCMGPIGVALGMMVNAYASPIIDAVMLAVVAGTFIYVGATEVIPEEWEESTHKWSKFGALMAGIVSIFWITQYTSTLGGGAAHAH